MLNVEDDIEKASMSYTPEVYPGRIIYFSSATRAAKFSLERWATLAGGGLDIREVPGDHLDMLKEPNVIGMAEYLRACLDQVTTDFS